MPFGWGMILLRWKELLELTKTNLFWSIVRLGQDLRKSARNFKMLDLPKSIISMAELSTGQMN